MHDLKIYVLGLGVLVPFYSLFLIPTTRSLSVGQDWLWLRHTFEWIFFSRYTFWYKCDLAFTIIGCAPYDIALQTNLCYYSVTSFLEDGFLFSLLDIIYFFIRLCANYLIVRNIVEYSREDERKQIHEAGVGLATPCEHFQAWRSQISVINKDDRNLIYLLNVWMYSD